METLADLLARLGNVPLSRVRFRPLPGTAKERDVIAARRSPKPRLCELIDRVLVEKAAVGSEEALLAGLILQQIWNYLDEHDLGFALGGDGIIRLWRGRLRIPDVSFFSWSRLPGGEFPSEAIASIVPDLAIEVLSRSNTKAEMALKLDDYFRAGTRLVWFVDPRTRTADVYSSATDFKHIGRSGKLSGDAILPGFSLPLAKLFSRIRRKT
jgi:Uma2 family endonuclease